MNKINFILPGLYELSDLNFNFLNLFFKHREYFLDNVNISAVYGNFQFCIWDGGRIFSNYKHTDAETIEKIKSIYNKDFNVPVRLVCTNTELNEYDCYDRFSNTILTLCENDINEIVVNSPILEKYIKDKELSLGYKHVYTPSLGSVELYKTSGHWDHYKDDMFPKMCLDDEEFVLRPMNCPHHMLVFKNDLHSYRDLPIRIGELQI